jgi:hypothetical protein
MINKIKIRKYKCLNDVDIPMGDMTVIVGPNGSGKSSILEVLGALHRRSDFPEMEMIVWYALGNTLGRPLVATRILQLPTDGYREVCNHITVGCAEYRKVKDFVRDMFGIEFNKDLTFSTKAANGIRPCDVGDGILKSIEYILAVMSVDWDWPTLILIDGIEEGLHPNTVEALIEKFRWICDVADVQFVITTHSADVLSMFEPEEIVLTALGEDGYTQAVCLSEHPDLDDWLKGLSPGELWLWDGEDEIIRRIMEAKDA